MKRQSINSLTGLRFMAALLVCTAHLAPHLLTSASPLYDFMTRLSAEGMTLFFVLSGFVIHYNYSTLISNAPKTGLYQFFVSRFARLVPLYFICLLLDIYSTSRHGANYSTESLSSLLIKILPFYATLTQTWVYQIIGGTSLIYPLGWILPLTWSISTEWFFYLVYPLVCFGLMWAPSVRTKINLLILISICSVGAVAYLAVHLDEINQFAVQHYGLVADFYSHNQDSFFRWLIYFSPYSRCAEFIMGCLVAAIYMQLSPVDLSASREQKIGMLLTLCSICVVMISHHYIWNPPQINSLKWMPYLHRSFGFAPAFALVIFCCARYNNAITTLLSSRLILIGGEISYSVYLLHLLLMEKIMNGRYHSYINSLSPMARYFIIMTVILSISYISYRLVEVPARQYLRRKWLIRRDTPQADGVVLV